MRLPLRSWKTTLAQLRLQATPCRRKNRNRRFAFESLDQRLVLSAVAGRYIFYNGSSFDGNDEAANVYDDGAIAPDKSALLPGQTATFANYTSYDLGINGIMIDVVGLCGSSLSASDFTFKVGNDNHPASWEAASTPASISVRAGAGVGGSDRVTITWDDFSISTQWLQVNVKANANTGLLLPDVFYFGNLTGETDGDFAVNIDDFNSAFGEYGATGVGIDDTADFNRDQSVDLTDMNDLFGLYGASLARFTAPPTPTVVGRHIFYNGSAFDGNNEAANAYDDGAIAPDKQALLPGQTAAFANYTSYDLGINGIMIDIAGLSTSNLTASDFIFKVGNDSTPAGWDTASAPTSITVRAGAGVGGSERVTIIWDDFAILSQWLQVTVKADENTGLAVPDVFYFGNLPGDADGDFAAGGSDYYAIAGDYGETDEPITGTTDFNRDQSVNGTDVSDWMGYYGATLEQLSAPGQAWSFGNGTTASFNQVGNTFGGGFYEVAPPSMTSTNLPSLLRQSDSGITAITSSVVATSTAWSYDDDVHPYGTPGSFLPPQIQNDPSSSLVVTDSDVQFSVSGPAHAYTRIKEDAFGSATSGANSGMVINHVIDSASFGQSYGSTPIYGAEAESVGTGQVKSPGTNSWTLVDPGTNGPLPAGYVVVQGSFVFKAKQTENLYLGDDGRYASKSLAGTAENFTVFAGADHYLNVVVEDGNVTAYTITVGSDTISVSGITLDPTSYTVMLNFQWVIATNGSTSPEIAIEYVNDAWSQAGSYTEAEGLYTACAHTNCSFQMSVVGFAAA